MPYIAGAPYRHPPKPHHDAAPPSQPSPTPPPGHTKRGRETATHRRKGANQRQEAHRSHARKGGQHEKSPKPRSPMPKERRPAANAGAPRGRAMPTHPPPPRRTTANSRQCQRRAAARQSQTPRMPRQGPIAAEDHCKQAARSRRVSDGTHNACREGLRQHPQRHTRLPRVFVAPTTTP